MEAFKIITATIVACALLTAARSVADTSPHFTYTQGTVDIDYPSGAQTAAANGTLVSPSDYVTTGAGSQAEIQIDDYSTIRMGPNSQVRVPDGDHHLQIAAGTVELAINGGDDPIEMDTPSITVSARESGAYRISVTDDGHTSVTVRSGHAEVITPNQTYQLDAGNEFVAYGSALNPQTSSVSAPAYDAFDDFNTQRDQVDDQAQTPAVDIQVGWYAPFWGAWPYGGFWPYNDFWAYGFGGFPVAYPYPYGYPYPYPVPYRYPYHTPRPHPWHANPPAPPRRHESDKGGDMFGTPVRIAKQPVRAVAPVAHVAAVQQHHVAAVQPHHVATVDRRPIWDRPATAKQQHHVAEVQQRPIWDRPVTTTHHVDAVRDHPVLDRGVSNAWERFDRARGSAEDQAQHPTFGARAGENASSDYDAPRIDTPQGVDATRIDTPRMEAPRMEAPRMEAPRIQAPPPSFPSGNFGASAPHVSGGRPPLRS